MKEMQTMHSGQQVLVCSHARKLQRQRRAAPRSESIVTRASEMNQIAVGLTDHGNMAGSVELYPSASKQGLLPFPGSELYFVPNTAQYRLDYAQQEREGQQEPPGGAGLHHPGIPQPGAPVDATHRNHFHKPTG